MVQTEEIRQRIRILMNFFNAKRYDEVITKVKPLLKKNPHEIIFHNLLALSLQGKGKTHEGIEILNKANGSPYIKNHSEYSFFSSIYVM